AAGGPDGAARPGRPPGAGRRARPDDAAGGRRPHLDPDRPGGCPMRTTLQMWLLLRRRDAGRSDPQRLTGVLAVVAFAVTTAVALLVLGGFQAFAERAASAPADDNDAGFYVLLAGTASGLLLIPHATLRGAASRLAVARRDE